MIVKTVSKFQEQSWKAALNAACIRRDTLLENQELIEVPDETQAMKTFNKYPHFHYPLRFSELI